MWLIRLAPKCIRKGSGFELGFYILIAATNLNFLCNSQPKTSTKEQFKDVRIPDRIVSYISMLVSLAYSSVDSYLKRNCYSLSGLTVADVADDAVYRWQPVPSV